MADFKCDLCGLEFADASSCPGCGKSMPRGFSIRDYLYVILALALIPLIGSVFGKQDDVEARIEQTLKHNPQVAEQLNKNESISRDELLRALPGRRIEGAHLARDSWEHWLYALLSAGVFLGLILLLSGRGSARPVDLLKVGVFTGTIGILLLLGVQLAAAATQGVWFRGGGVVVILFYIVKFIGFSYQSALDSDSGFVLSLLGFTFGVGFCEELCKALPLLWHFRRKATLDWRGALTWGLATGAGFGVSEAITYSSDYYNGVSTVGIYGVRFISCVALHAVWSGAVGITLWRNQRLIQGELGWLDYFAPLLRILGIAMILHGLYDTLLKRNYEVAALAVAVASFAWLAFTIERARRLEDAPAADAP